MRLKTEFWNEEKRCSIKSGFDEAANDMSRNVINTGIDPGAKKEPNMY
ncbi:MAG: hypothetical protein Kow0042_15670 [Calditrichia bacterium]